MYWHSAIDKEGRLLGGTDMFFDNDNINNSSM